MRSLRYLLQIALLVLWMSSCATSSTRQGLSTSAQAKEAPSDEHLGNLYQRGLASWYGPGFQGKPTASGEPFDRNQMTAAHKKLPFGTIVKVRSLSTGRVVEVRINDRGPFIKGRVIDLSQAAAEELGMIAKGHDRVAIFLK